MSWKINKLAPAPSKQALEQPGFSLSMFECILLYNHLYQSFEAVFAYQKLFNKLY